MRLVLVFGRHDPARVRFAVSPLWETVTALRVLREPHRRRYHLPWLDLVRPDLDRLDLRPLLALSPRTGWTPDFLTPAPAGPGTDIADQLAQVRATAGASPSCGSPRRPGIRRRWPACSAGPGPPCWNRSPNRPPRTPWPAATASPRAPCPST